VIKKSKNSSWWLWVTLFIFLWIKIVKLKIIRDINIQFDDCIPTAFLINNETRHLFIGSQNGSIYSIKLTQSNTMIDVNTSLHLLQMNVHQGAVTKVWRIYLF